MLKKIFRIRTIFYIVLTCIILQHLFPSKAAIFIRIGSLAIAIPIMGIILVFFLARGDDATTETRYDIIEYETFPVDTRSEHQKFIDRQNEIRLVEKANEGKGFYDD